MPPGAASPFGAQLKALREQAGFTQEELAAIAGLSVHAVSALERGERRRPHLETVRALSAALDLTAPARDRLVASARARAHDTAVDDLSRRALPIPPTTLLGRDGDLRTLREMVADPAARLITLVGPGGVGKTRLALELAHWIAEQGAARIVFVPLAAVRETLFVASAIAEALGIADVSAAELPMRVRLACKDGPTWIVIDNFEQVLEAASLVATLLTTVASLRFLATSRAALHLRGEREYIVGPLMLPPGAEGLPPPDLARAPAVRLFVERVRDAQPDFRLTAANGPTVVAICQRLDTLPLAMELAAPWIKLLDPDGLLRRLQQDVLPSTMGPLDLPERQRTMNATVAWSYELLDESQRYAFRRLGVLPGPFSMDAAAGVLASAEAASATTEEALGAVASLIDRSLLLRAESALPSRLLYQMLETVRAYAANELVAVGQYDDAMEGLTGYCRREAALAASGLNGSAQAAWLDRVRDDLDNYRAAMSWLLRAGRPTEAADISLALKYFWMIRGHATEGLRWYEEILAAPGLSSRGESRALVGAAGMWFARGELERPPPALERLLSLARGTGDMEMVAEAEYTFGHIERVAGNAPAARARFTTSLEAFRKLMMPVGVGKALIGMAALALNTSDAAETERLVTEATSVLRDEAPWFQSFGLWIRASLAVRRGHADEAIAWTRESLVLIRALKDKFAFVYALVPLAAAAALKGEDAWAARILGTRDAVAERTGAMLTDRSVQDLRAQAERDVRVRLGADRWARAYAAGRMSSIDLLLKDIERVLPHTP
jgi:predicted ATPase/DNA-binding XRE family transcriptional regulator